MASDTCAWIIVRLLHTLRVWVSWKIAHSSTNILNFFELMMGNCPGENPFIESLNNLVQTITSYEIMMLRYHGENFVE